MPHGEAEEVERGRLMGEGEGDGYGEEQRRDPEPDLQRSDAATDTGVEPKPGVVVG